MLKYFRAILTGVALIVVLLAACSPAPAATPTLAPVVPPTPAPAPSISVEGAYGHASPMMPGSGGLFMVIKNTGMADDKLVSGKSDACGSIEIHEMVKKADGTMGMNLLTDPVVIPSGGQVELKDGGMHIMCIQMKPDLFKVGSQINLTLNFAVSGEKMVMADIREVAMTTPMAMDSTPMAGSGAPDLSITGAYGYASPSMPGAGGLFMVIKNAGMAADKLVSGKSDACGSVEIHEMVKKADGTMGMNLLTDPQDVPAGGQLELKPGSLHIMCIQMKPDLFKVGAKINLTLNFATAGEKMVMADIRESPMTTPMAMNSTPRAMDTPMAGSGAPDLSITGAYGQASPMMPGSGGLFMVIKNAGMADDKLVSGKSDACGSIEIHEMVKKADGTMGMNLVTDPQVVPAGGQLELKEGGLHIMCIQVKPNLFKVGSQINLTLTFEKSGDKMVMADIREAAMTKPASLVVLGSTKEISCTMGFEVTKDNRLIEYDDVTANPKVVTFAGTIVNKPDLTAAHGLIIIKIDTAGTAKAPLGSYTVSHWINFDDKSVGQAYAKDANWKPLFYATLEEAQKLTEASDELNMFCCKISFPYPKN